LSLSPSVPHSLSPSHSKSLSLSVSQSLSLSVPQSLSPSVSQSLSLSVPQSLSLSVPQSLSPSVSKSLSLSVPQSLSPSIPQPFTLSVPQSFTLLVVPRSGDLLWINQEFIVDKPVIYRRETRRRQIITFLSFLLSYIHQEKEQRKNDPKQSFQKKENKPTSNRVCILSIFFPLQQLTNYVGFSPSSVVYAKKVNQGKSLPPPPVKLSVLIQKNSAR